MNTKPIIAAAALATALIALPALAKEACLQNNRIETTKVIDSSTILATDRNKNAYTIHLRGTCVGLNRASELLTFRPKMELGCLQKGDSISYSQPGNPSQRTSSIAVHGPQTQIPCFVDSVSEGAPAGGEGEK